MICVAVGLLLAGCGPTVRPPTRVLTPARVYIADYGRHSSMVLPCATGGYVEYAFGDWDFLALVHTGKLNGIRAMLLSTQATLGRRAVPLTSDPSTMLTRLGAKRILTIDVDLDRALDLSTELGRRYASQAADGKFSKYTNLYHVKDDAKYGVLNNCNHATAGWARALGAKVEGFTLFSNFRPGENRIGDSTMVDSRTDMISNQR